MSELTPQHENSLFERIAEILAAARTHVTRTVNTAMVDAYWHIGREIIEVEQGGVERAGYGDELVKHISKRLTARYGKGFNATNIKRMRQFYQAFPAGSRLPELAERTPSPHLVGGDKKSAALRHHSASTSPAFPPQLSWTHYRKLLTVENDGARAFYEIEAARSSWSTRQLEPRSTTSLSAGSGERYPHQFSPSRRVSAPPLTTTYATNTHLPPPQAGAKCCDAGSTDDSDG